eukprot:gnl/TRDRNA2_/TRDRNA2_82792_c0_seq1.p1 gnl/TRDRNA2_/TRDRNA2_82792_c0~~gnl/TRDRNA2_/TRDRNA2_82792_c0_seq1.p1  ORF type:complete len:330 (-),score=49.74 gnl/TRDRNA2_/TRDRNA2_82792_c0_seq1:101-1090(-)
MASAKRRLGIVARHIDVDPVATTVDPGVPGKTSFNDTLRLKAFASDPEWMGKPFWMLNVLKFRDDGSDAARARYAAYSEAMRKEVLPQIGAAIVMSGYARTIIGKNVYHAVAIVEYPSPEAFLKMVTSGQQAQKNEARLEGLEEQLLIPLTAGWFYLHQPAPKPARPIHHFTAENVWTTPGGLVGSAARGARVGETSSTRAQALDFVSDLTLATGPVWHLNLLHFVPDHGQATYRNYAKAMGSKAGILSLFGARSTLASRCHKSLIGDVDFDQAIFVEYPSRDAYLSMSASAEYLKTAHFRHEALQDTYIISCKPEVVEEGSPLLGTSL